MSKVLDSVESPEQPLISQSDLNNAQKIKKGRSLIRSPSKSQKKNSKKFSKNHNFQKVQRIYTQIPQTQQQTSLLSATANKLKKDSNSNNPLVAKHHHNQLTSLKISKSFKHSKITPTNMNHTFTANQKDHLSCNRTKQELIQENIQLKNAINKLKQEFLHMKIQAESQKRKNRTFTNKLNREFKKDFYYSDLNKNSVKSQKGYNNLSQKDFDYQSITVKNQQNAKSISLKTNQPPITITTTNEHSPFYMIAGVKNQYEQLRTKYESLELQYNQYKQSDLIQKVEEYKIYCHSLDYENSKLIKTIENLKLKVSDIPAEKKQGQILQLSNKIEKLENKNKSIKQHLKNNNKQLSENKKLIKYLQQTIIKKQNQNFHILQNIKHKEKQQLLLQQEKNKQITFNQDLKRSYQKQLEDTNETNKKQAKIEKDLFEKTLSAKNAEIQKLQKQIIYLSTIVSYWKPQNISERSDQGSQRQENISQESEEFGLKSSKGLLSLMENQESDNKNVEICHNRKRKTSAINNQLTSIKKRKVHIQELSQLQIAEILKYRLIGNNISLDMLKNYFEPSQQQQQQHQQKQADSNNQRQYFHNKYITQIQLNNILQSTPFNLQKKSAYLLSRYIVEDQFIFENGDVHNPFVYEDETNEIQRNLVKSILRGFISDNGKNRINVREESWNIDQFQRQWKSVMEEIGKKVTLVLGSIAPNGFVDKNRWKECVQNMGITIQNDLMQWSIGCMMVQGTSLNTLPYKILTQPKP